MTHLILTPNVADIDGIYQQLIEIHDGKSADQSLMINARLILILINHIGDERVLSEALALADSP